MKLDFTSFQKALGSMQKAVERSTAAPKDEELRDAVIQRFEYSFELAWKMLKRHLEQVMPNPSEVDKLAYRDMIREAAERGLLSAPEKWMLYRESRNLTSHVYDQVKAAKVYEQAVRFLQDAKKLLIELEKRNHA